MSQEFYRNESGVVVTNSAVNDGNGTIYQLRNINSVRVVQQDIPWKGTIIKLFFAGAFSLAFFPTIAGLIHPSAAIFASLAVLGGFGYLAWKTFKQPRKMYSLILSTSSGEVDSFSSLEADEVQKMANAVSEALSMSNAA